MCLDFSGVGIFSRLRMKQYMPAGLTGDLRVQLQSIQGMSV